VEDQEKSTKQNLTTIGIKYSGAKKMNCNSKMKRSKKMMGGKMQKEKKMGYMKGGAIKNAMPVCKPN
jgi:hypothetical protein